VSRRSRKRKAGDKPEGAGARQLSSAVRQTGANPNAAGSEAQPNLSSKEFTAWAAVVLFLYGFLATWGQFDFSNLMGYYSMLATALLDGRVSITYTPDEVHLIDMLPFEGRYYLQWGPVPALFHLAAKLGGGELSDRVACILAGWVASLAFLRIVLVIREWHFPHLPLWVCRAFFLAFAFGSPTTFVSLRGTIYHESIGMAAMFVILGFLFLLRYTTKPSAGTCLLCGTMIALAVGTRVTVLICAGVFFLGLLVLERHWRPSPKTSAARLTAFALPVALACSMHLANNQARFGSPWDFGLHYRTNSQANTSNRNEFGVPWGFRVSRIPRNFLHYVLAPIQLQAELPWIINDGWPPSVGEVHRTSHGNPYRTEGMASMLLVTPFLLFGFWSFRLWRNVGGCRREFSVFGAIAAASGTLSFLLLLSFNDTSRRYMQDFVPAMLIVAFIGVGLWRRGKASLSRWRWPAAGVLVFSAILHIHLSFTQPFFTPPPDPSAMKTFAEWGPVARWLFDWPELAKDEAVIRNDLGVHFLQEGRHADALEQFTVANELMPGAPVVEKNLWLTRALLRQRQGRP